jgi:hypothetical protein
MEKRGQFVTHHKIMDAITHEHKPASCTRDGSILMVGMCLAVEEAEGRLSGLGDVSLIHRYVLVLTLQLHITPIGPSSQQRP